MCMYVCVHVYTYMYTYIHISRAMYRLADSDSLHVMHDVRFSSMSGNVKRRVPCYLAHCTVSVIITVPPVCTR